MYDKFILLEHEKYVPYVREGGARIALEACDTLLEAQRLLDSFPPDCGERNGSGRLASEIEEDWFHDKLDREDAFENFIVQAEQCR